MSNAAARQMVHVWDASQCFNCGACIVACSMTNYAGLAYSGAKIDRGLATNIERVETEVNGATRLLLSQCQQCTNAPCLAKCPKKAISRNDDGLVVTDEAKCIQCGKCVAACPYGARWTDPKTETPKSCMGLGCKALVASGQQPACVQACPASARAFGDLLDPASVVAKRVNAPGYRRAGLDRGTKPNFWVIEKG